jgi:hypothetical protein
VTGDEDIFLQTVQSSLQNLLKHVRLALSKLDATLLVVLDGETRNVDGLGNDGYVGTHRLQELRLFCLCG